jgi:hypothetical protein
MRNVREYKGRQTVVTKGRGQAYIGHLDHDFEKGPFGSMKGSIFIRVLFVPPHALAIWKADIVMGRMERIRTAQNEGLLVFVDDRVKEEGAPLIQHWLLDFERFRVSMQTQSRQRAHHHAADLPTHLSSASRFSV